MKPLITTIRNRLQQQKQQQSEKTLNQIRAEKVTTVTFSKDSVSIAFCHLDNIICINFNPISGYECVTVGDAIVHSTINKKSKYSTLNLAMNDRDFQLKFGIFSNWDAAMGNMTIELSNDSEVEYQYTIDSFTCIKYAFTTTKVAIRLLLRWILLGIVAGAGIFAAGLFVGKLIGQWLNAGGL